MRRNLTIRAQTFITIGLTFLVLVAALYGLTSWYLESGFGRAEEQETRRNVVRVRAALLDNVSRLNATAGDWACWQDAYDYMAGKNPAFIRESLTPQTIAGINVHMVVLLRPDGSVKYATGFNPQQVQSKPLPAAMRAHMRPGSKLLQHASVHSSRTGLLPLAGGVWMIASRPVITSDKQGPIQGTLILGKKLDRLEVRRLTQILDLRFTVDAGPASRNISVQPISDRTIIGQTALLDLYGKPTLQLAVSSPREIWRQGQNSRRSLLVSMIVLCIVGSALTIYLMEKLLLRRVRALSRQVREITSHQDFSSRVKTKSEQTLISGDEILILTAAVNDLLSTVERSHASLQASESRFRTFMEHSPALAFIKDSEGRLTYANPAFEHVIGCSHGELIGCSDYDLWSPEVAQQLRANDQEILRTGRFMQLEESTSGEEGPPKDWLVYKFPLEDNNGQTLLAGMAVDITERKAMERLKNEFISVVSHELRTPVTSIRGAIGLLVGGAAGEVSPDVKKLLQLAERNSQRLTDLLNDILDLQKMEAGSMVMESRPLDLVQVVANAIELNAQYAREFNVSIHLESTLSAAQVLGDAARLQQVMANLLSNAAKFSPPEETITVRINRSEAVEGRWVRVSIHNCGEEIPESFRPRVFAKFAQADSTTTRTKGGTGLGLSISKAIVEQHRGRIGFETDAVKGTTFFFEMLEVESSQ